MKLVFTPDWFAGFDVSIEIFSFIILALFFYFSIKSYKATQNKKALYLGIGFFLIALAEIASILTKLVLFYDTTFTRQIGEMVITYQITKSVDIFYKIGFFFHKLFTLFGLYIIYRFPLKKVLSKDMLLTGLFIIVSAILSQFFFFVFHLITLVLLIMITQNFNKIYEKNKLFATKMLVVAFIVLTASHLIFSLSQIRFFYVVAQIMQLTSYVILLGVILRISKKQNAKYRKSK
ncbi:hypothetical protein FJZ17_04520 [Candidatus Pacearchaeota archaeon]|nr:hypothetical protein [Candidatus Pacearchaeota archaeon]